MVANPVAQPLTAIGTWTVVRLWASLMSFQLIGGVLDFPPFGLDSGEFQGGILARLLPDVGIILANQVPSVRVST